MHGKNILIVGSNLNVLILTIGLGLSSLICVASFKLRIK